MELPSEVIRIIMENLNNKQRQSIKRVCMLWRYLAATFKYIPRNLEEFKKALNQKYIYKLFFYIKNFITNYLISIYVQILLKEIVHNI